MLKRQRNRWLAMLMIVLGALLVTSGVALAQQVPDQSMASYTLTWWTVDGGGGVASGGSFTLMGTAGQPEPGPVLTGGDFTLTSGYWPGGLSSLIQKLIFLPFIVH